MTDMRASAPSFLARRGTKAKAAPPPEEGEVDPSVVAFLSTVRTTSQENKDLKTENESLRLAHDQDSGRINLLQQELHRAIRQRDGYQRGYAEQKAEISVLITAAKAARGQAYASIDAYRSQAEASVKAAFDGFLETAESVLRSITQNLVSEGINPIDNPQGNTQSAVLSDEQIRLLSKKFGADARTDGGGHEGDEDKQEHE